MSPIINIIFFTHYPALYGANRSLINLVEGLDKNKFSISLISRMKGAITEYFASQGFRVIIHPYSLLFSRENRSLVESKARIKQLSQSVEILSEKITKWNADIIYSNSSVIELGLLTAKVIGKPHIWHIREYGDLDYNLKPDMDINLFKLLLQFSDGLIFVSQALKDHILPQGNHPYSQVIYNGVASLSLLKTLKKNDKRSLKKNIDTFALIGFLNSKKGQETAIKAFAHVTAKHPESRLILAGGGDTSAIDQLITNLNLQKNISILGEIIEPLGIFVNADVALMCSTNEAMGRVTAEAMGCSCPVIGFNRGGTSELIQNGYNGLLYNDNHKELAELILETIENPSLCRQMGENAYRFAQKNFTVENYCDQVSNFIKSLSAETNKKKFSDFDNHINHYETNPQTKHYYDFYKKILT